MMVELETLQWLQVGLLFCFIAVSSLFLVMTVVNRQRVERVLGAFPTGAIRGLPVKPFLFLIAVLAVFAVAEARSIDAPVAIFVGYMVGCLFWIAGSYLGGTVFLTELGLVRRLNSPGGAIAWGQVEDYFRRPGTRYTRFVFFHRDEENRRRRFEVRIRTAEAARFSELVDEMMESRVSVRRRQRSGHREVEGG